MASALEDSERRRIVLMGGSGVEMASLGVEPDDWFALLAELRVACSLSLSIDIAKGSGLVEAFSTFALGRVPSAAMFATTPCLSIPASAKDGRAGASWGSILGRGMLDLSLSARDYTSASASGGGEER